MGAFINRVHELEMIESAFSALDQPDRLINTPIIDFYGVEGIGKSTILGEVAQKCREKNIPCLQTDVSRHTGDFSLDMIKQAEKYISAQSASGAGKDGHEASIEPVKTLLKQGPLVLLLDAVDPANTSTVETVEKMLGELFTYSSLFVVIASRRGIAFEHEKAVARRLTVYPLHPFNRDTSEEYIKSIQGSLKPEVRDLIFEWTHGYPLAMNVMVEGIVQQGLDPTDDIQKQEMIALLIDRVIVNSLLKHVKPGELQWFRVVLSLLALPRRFNLIIMQKLIERFEPELRLANSLAYIVLPKRIDQATGALGWIPAKGGFAIDDPVRHLLALELRITDLERYYAVNRFLAELNWLTAREVTGPDRIRYQCEALYHSAQSGNPEQMPELVASTLTQIIADAERDPEQLVQFYEEFTRDEELREGIGQEVTTVLSTIAQHLARAMDTLAQQEEDEQKRLHYRYSSFFYTIHDPAISDPGAWLQISLLQLRQSESPAFLQRLYTELEQDKLFREALGENIQVVRDQIQQRDL